MVLAAIALPTVRGARGRPSARANWVYDSTRPGSMRISASHTLIWKLVPRSTRCTLSRVGVRGKICCIRAWARASSRASVAAGHRLRSSASIAASSALRKAKWHTPRAVHATRALPKGVGAKPWPMSMPRAAALISPGVIASQLTIRSCSRLGLPRPAERVTSSRLADCASCWRAYSLVRYCRKRLGEMPAHSANTRCRCAGLRWTAAATSSSPGWLRAWARMKAIARATRA